MESQNRLYNDLSWLWPLWGTVQDYRPYSDQIIRHIKQYAGRPLKTLLDVGCGGGKNVYNFKREFTVTGLDISPIMLEQAQSLNPDCEFIQADMRTYTLDRAFDVVLVDDAVSYMTTEADLAAVFECAFKHLATGGIMVVGPDETRESFRQNATSFTQSKPVQDDGGPDVVFIENNYDPDPSDTVYDALMMYLIRENGKLRIETDLHILGLFSIDTWRRFLQNTGFQIHEEAYIEDQKTYTEFICRKDS